MEKTEYLLWIDSGVTAIAQIVSKTENGIYKLINPHMVVNVQYGVMEDGSLVNPNTPGVVKTRFNVEMAPFYFAEYIGGRVEFTLKDVSLFCHSVISDESAPIVKQYKEVTANLS